MQSITLNERGLHLAFMHGFFSFAKDPIHYSTGMNYSLIVWPIKKIANLICRIVLLIPNHPLIHSVRLIN